MSEDEDVRGPCESLYAVVDPEVGLDDRPKEEASPLSEAMEDRFLSLYNPCPPRMGALGEAGLITVPCCPLAFRFNGFNDSPKLPPRLLPLVLEAPSTVGASGEL